MAYVGVITMEEYALTKSVAVNGRSVLEEKMAAVFVAEIGVLSSDLQKILIDDMVTAFENRLNVLNRSAGGDGF